MVKAGYLHVTQGDKSGSNNSNKSLGAEHFQSRLNAALLRVRHPSAFIFPYKSLRTSVSNHLFLNVCGF